MNISIKHHYLPVFYLKNFTNNKGQFHIRNVKTNFDKYWQRPENFFYIRDDNNVFIDGEKTDFIEKEFSKIDSNSSIIFTKIFNNINLNDEEKSNLELFICSLYWRIKSNRTLIEEIISTTHSLKDFGFILVDKEKKEVSSCIQADILEKMKNDSDFLKFYRLMLAPYNFIKYFNKSVPFTHIINLDFNLPSVISDNPLIFKSTNVKYPTIENFILPISNKKILIRSSIESIKIIPQLRFLIDMFVIKQASEYIAFTDSLYLDRLIKTFAYEYGTIENLRKTIFECIEHHTSN